MQSQVFEVPNSDGTLWLPALMLVPVLIGLALAIVFWPRTLRVELTADSVAIQGSIYGRKIARKDLDLATARVTRFDEEPGLRPALRTNGVGLPNYRVGWFRLRNHERALCFLTTQSDVVYLPTTQNFALLISLTDAEKFLTTLRGTSS